MNFKGFGEHSEFLLISILIGSQLNNLYYKIIRSDGFLFPIAFMGHYYILCLFAKGQTKNLKGLRSKNKKLEGFTKQK